MTIRDIARAAGWKSQESLRAALRNPTVSRETLRRALAIRPNDHRQVAREFPGFMLTRRLQALAAMGWSAREIADRSGVSIFRIREVRFGSADSMYRSTAEPLLTLYEDLQDRVGGSESTRRLAQRNGWLPPAAWDNIDNPDEKPRPKKWQRRIPDAA